MKVLNLGCMARNWNSGTMSQPHSFSDKESDDANMDWYHQSESGEDSDSPMMSVDGELPPALMSFNCEETIIEGRGDINRGDFDTNGGNNEHSNVAATPPEHLRSQFRRYHGNPQVALSSGGRASRFRQGAGLPFMARDQTAIAYPGARSSLRLQASRRSSGGGHIPLAETFGGSQPRSVSPEVRGRQPLGDISNLRQASGGLQHLRRPAGGKRTPSPARRTNM